MLTFISALLIKWSFNFRDVHYHYFSPKSVTHLKARHAKLTKELYEWLGTEKASFFEGGDPPGTWTR